MWRADKMTEVTSRRSRGKSKDNKGRHLRVRYLGANATTGPFSIKPAFQVTAIADASADQQAKARELKPGASIYARASNVLLEKSAPTRRAIAAIDRTVDGRTA